MGPHRCFHLLLACSAIAAVTLSGQVRTEVAEARGVRIAIPAGWEFNRNLAAAGGPVSIKNFAGAYLRGGMIPLGGAQIEVTRVPKQSDLTGYIRKELVGVRALILQEGTQGAHSGIRASFIHQIGPGVDLAETAFYIPHGDSLYKFYLTRRTGDKNDSSLIQLFENEVRGAELS